MNRRYKSIDRNQYDQLFTNNAYFVKVHPMDSNRKAGDDLKILYQYFGVLEKLTFDGYKEQACKGTKFEKEAQRKCIDYQICETDLHNQNPVEGVIRELRRKWYCNMVKKRAPRQIWDYGESWLSEVNPMSNYSENSINGGIPLKTLPARLLIYRNNLNLGSMKKSGSRIMLVYLLMNLRVGYGYYTGYGG